MNNINFKFNKPSTLLINETEENDVIEITIKHKGIKKDTIHEGRFDVNLLLYGDIDYCRTINVDLKVHGNVEFISTMSGDVNVSGTLKVKYQQCQGM